MKYFRENFKEYLREVKWDALIAGILYIRLGIVALVLPETMERALGYLLAVALILTGAVSMICYLLREAHQNYYRNDFMHGLIEIGAGILVLYHVELVISLIPFLLGIMILISGCSKLQDVIDMKRWEYGNWGAMLVVAAVNAGLGILFMFNPFKMGALLFRLIGVGLILSGVTDCAAVIYFANKIKKYFDGLRTVDSTCVEIINVAERKTEAKKEKSEGEER